MAENINLVQSSAPMFLPNAYFHDDVLRSRASICAQTLAKKMVNVPHAAGIAKADVDSLDHVWISYSGQWH